MKITNNARNNHINFFNPKTTEMEIQLLNEKGEPSEIKFNKYPQFICNMQETKPCEEFQIISSTINGSYLKLTLNREEAKSIINFFNRNYKKYENG